MRSYNTSFWMNRIVWVLPTVFTVIVKWVLDKYCNIWNINEHKVKSSINNKNITNSCLKLVLIFIVSSIFGIFLMLVPCYYVDTWIFVDNDLVIIYFYIQYNK